MLWCMGMKFSDELLIWMRNNVYMIHAVLWLLIGFRHTSAESEQVVYGLYVAQT